MARSPGAGRVLPVNQKQQGIARLAKSRGVSQSRGGDTNQAFPSDLVRAKPLKSRRYYAVPAPSQHGVRKSRVPLDYHPPCTSTKVDVAEEVWRRILKEFMR